MTAAPISRRLARAAFAFALTVAAAACAGSGSPDAAAKEPQAGKQVALAQADSTKVVVYKTPTCGCCKKWVEHLQQHGFQVETHDMDNVQPVKVANGLPGGLESCHTSIVNGYVVEGHVPADVIRRLLRERPEGVAGIAVPGMPAGSPGMEGPYPSERYDIVAFTKDGKQSVYESR